MNKFQTYLLTFSIIIWVICGTLWKFTSTPIYYIGNSQILFVSSLIIYRTAIWGVFSMPYIVCCTSFKNADLKTKI